MAGRGKVRSMNKGEMQVLKWPFIYTFMAEFTVTPIYSRVTNDV